jgi:predicted HTH domain antitoxin
VRDGQTAFERRNVRGWVKKAYNIVVEITAKLPDDLAKHPNAGREALEALVLEGYRSGAFSHYQASQLLGLSRFAFDGLLKERHIYDHAYGVEDLEQDEETLRQLQSKDSSRR